MEEKHVQPNQEVPDTCSSIQNSTTALQSLNSSRVYEKSVEAIERQSQLLDAVLSRPIFLTPESNGANTSESLNDGFSQLANQLIIYNKQKKLKSGSNEKAARNNGVTSDVQSQDMSGTDGITGTSEQNVNVIKAIASLAKLSVSHTKQQQINSCSDVKVSTGSNVNVKKKQEQYKSKKIARISSKTNSKNNIHNVQFIPVIEEEHDSTE